MSEREPSSAQPPLFIGTTVLPWGKIKAVGHLSGERYYWLIDKHGGISMMPSEVVERRYADAKP